MGSMQLTKHRQLARELAGLAGFAAALAGIAGYDWRLALVVGGAVLALTRLAGALLRPGS